MVYFDNKTSSRNKFDSSVESSWGDGLRTNQHPKINHYSQGISLIEIMVDVRVVICYWCDQIGIHEGV